MTGSSPAPRRSHQWPSPQRSAVLTDILNEDRNSEARHRHLIEAAKKEHDRVREEAERVIEQHVKKEERQRLLDEKKKEEERIRLEQQIAAERLKLLALQEKKVSIPPPPPVEPELPRAPAEPSKSAPLTNSQTGQQQSSAQPNGPAAQLSTQGVPPGLGLFGGRTPNTQPAVPNSLASQKSAQTRTAQSVQTAKPLVVSAGGNNPFGPNPQINGTSPAVSTQLVPAPVSTPPVTAQVTTDRYMVVHRNLKSLRKSLAEQAKSNKALKDRMGDMRREIRKSVGQLTNGAGVNRIQQHSITTTLREALSNQVQSQFIDVGNFVFEPRNPVQGASHNDDQLPSLFLYLLNIFAKAAIAQFINEAGARPETADPVGVCIAATFSDPDFHWRGVSLIDILLAKFRRVCPVLFGYRGNEKTEQGRERLGWWKENGKWVAEQQHMDRMTGLGAGFAAVALRKFAMSKKENPYPARNYWAAMAKIVNTPASEISSTQCVVLKSMIQNYEQKFIDFYGTAALAALRLCLVDFPARATEKSAAVSSLEVLAQLLKRDSGLVLG